MQWFRNDDKIVVAISYDFNCMEKKKEINLILFLKMSSSRIQSCKLVREKKK